MTTVFNVSDEESSTDPQPQPDQPPNEDSGEQQGDVGTERPSKAGTEQTELTEQQEQ